MREIKHIAKKSKEIADINRNKAQIVTSIKDAYKKNKKGKISDLEFSKHVNEKHNGYSKQEWISKCDSYISNAHDNIREDFNSLIEKRYSSNTKMNIFIIVLIALFGIYLLSPTLIGLVITEQDITVNVDEAFSVSSNLSLSLSDIGYFSLDGNISRKRCPGV